MSYMYSLRYALQPHQDNGKKIEDLLTFCREAKIDDVNFFINHEEINQAHLTYAETEEWLILSQELKEILAQENISFSLNPGITLMHGDRGRVANPALGLRQMVDATGLKANAVACPSDPKWQEYIAKTYGLYAKVEPDYLWLEDDFRHFNHKPVLWGCFCDEHMKAYQQELGYIVSREEFVQEILQPGKPSRARQVYLDICRNEMLVTIEKIQQAVHKISPTTKLSLMTSQPNQHATEARDWQQTFEKLSGEHPFVARPHLPSYNEVTPKVYSNGFNSITRVTADLLGDEAELFPELENYMYSRYAKSTRFSRFQLESSLILHPKGSTMNLFDMMGTGVVLTYQLQEMLAETKDFLSLVTDLDLKVSEQTGVHVLYGTEGSYSIETKIGQQREEIIPREDAWLEMLGAFGISNLPKQYSSDLADKVVALSGEYLRQLTNEEITQLFDDNYVLLDGSSAAILVERGLGRLANIKSCKWQGVRTGQQTYEQIDNGNIYCGVAEARMTLMQQTGDFLRIEYADDAVDIISNAYDEYNNFQGPVCVKTKNCFILPISWDLKDGWNSQYISFKEEMIRQVINEATGQEKLVAMTIDMPYCNVFHYRKTGKDFYIVANFSTDNYDKLTIQLPNHPTNLKEYSRQGIQEVAYGANEILVSLESYELKVFEVLG